MSQAFTFEFDNDDVEDDSDNLLKEPATDVREDSAVQMNPHLEVPKLHRLQEMV